MEENCFPQIKYDEPFNDRAKFEARAKGYLAGIKVLQADGNLYEVVFYDCNRLRQDLEYEVSTGRMCVADIGMIVVAQISEENITNSIRHLTAEGYFLRQLPISKVEL